MIKKILNFLQYKYFLSLLGLSFILYFIWYRYIRERLPRDIPFEPTILNIVFLLSICIIYSYILLRIIKPRPIHPIILHVFQKTQFLYKPFYALDTLIRSNNYVALFIKWLGIHLQLIKNTNLNILLYFIWYCIPRISLLTFLLVDTFYYHKLHYIYRFASITLIIFICYYIIYSIRIALEQYIEHLDHYYQVEITSVDYEGSNYFTDIENISWDYDISLDPSEEPQHYLTVKRFILYQINALLFENTLYDYKCVITWPLVYKYAEIYPHFKLYKDLDKITKSDRIILEREFHTLLSIILSLQFFIDINDSREMKKSKLLYIVQIVLTLLYIICWGYILVLTIFNIRDITLLETISNNIEPFSGLFM